jgi:CRP/FNR family transcriptional regulator, cyclic AMP receptor protein
MLEDVGLFDKLSDDTMQTLRRQARNRHLEKGAMLFSPGDPSDAIYVIENGRIRVWAVSASGYEVTLNVLKPGTVLGEIGVLDGSDRTAGASALAATELLAISRAAFFSALDKDSQLARNVIALLCDRLRWVSARMEDSALRSAPERLARMMLHLCDDYGVEVAEGLRLSVNLNQSELAQWTHMTRETLNKIMNQWSDKGVLVQSRGTITVHDLERLNEIAEFGEDA